MSIYTLKTDKLKFTTFTYKEDDKEFINFKVKKNGSNINYFKIIDEDFFENNDMFSFIKDNLSKIDEESLNMNFDEKELKITIKSNEYAEINVKFTLTSMTNIDTKNENNILTSILVENQSKITSMKEDKIKEMNDIYSDLSKAIENCITTKNTLDCIRNNIIKILKDDFDKNPLSDESDDEPPTKVKKSVGSKHLAYPVKKVAKKAAIEFSSDDE